MRIFGSSSKEFSTCFYHTRHISAVLQFSVFTFGFRFRGSFLSMFAFFFFSVFFLFSVVMSESVDLSTKRLLTPKYFSSFAKCLRPVARTCFNKLDEIASCFYVQRLTRLRIQNVHELKLMQNWQV
jgi:hypothetical protein